MHERLRQRFGRPAQQHTERTQQLACAQHTERANLTEALEVFSGPEDVTEFAEELAVREGRAEQGESEPKRKANHIQRLQRARARERAEKEASRAEIEALQAQLAERALDSTSDDDGMQRPDEEYAVEQPNTNGEAPPEGETYVQTPEEREAYLHHVREQATRDADERADYRARERQVAASFPDYAETIQAAGDVDIGDTAARLLRESPHGPFIAYGLAKTVDGLEILHALKDADPLTVAKFVARAEAQIEHGNRQRAMRQQRPQQQQQPQPRRVTNAPRPVGYLKGGTAGPPSELGQVNNLVKKWYGDRS